MFGRLFRRVNKPNIRKLSTCKFEIFGKVQGVFFRQSTKHESNRLGVRGWVENTDSGTVRGELEGTEEDLKKMQEWLSKTGSRDSKIDRAIFSEPKIIPAFFYREFTIKD